MNRIVVSVCLFCWSAATTLAGVSRIEIHERIPYAEGREFEGVGAYEILRGTVHFAVGPQAEANRRVVDVELAPRNGEGLVEFSADLEILVPVDRAKATGALLYDVNNRGNRKALGLFNTGADHFLMRRGWIVVTSGWIAQVLPGDNRLRMDAPPALEKGKPLVAPIRVEMVTNEPLQRMSVTNRPELGGYPPAPGGLANATLTWRLREADPRVPIPRSQWRLEVTPTTVESSEDSPAYGHCLPLVELVVAGGFQPGYIYELIYEAQGSVVQGLGLAGIRDLVSFLKHENSAENPLRTPDGSAAKRTIGFGISQSGRCLRMFLHQGFNADERGRQVFDGLIPHVAGGGLGFFNHRFASPSRYNSQHVNHAFPADMFPFTYGDETNPFTGETDGLLREARRTDVAPKIMHIQNSAEYWHRSGSLVHTDPLGKHDATIPPEVRVYAVGGAEHSAGDAKPQPRGEGQLPPNPTDYRPILRALLVALDDWIAHGTEPPPSRYPRISDGTLVDWRLASSGWQALPGARYPEVIQRPEAFDYGPKFNSHGRITLHPPQSHGEFVVKVAAHDEDNNERGMILLPTVAVPVATFTGWNLRHRSIGAENELLRLVGARIPLPRDAEERQRTGDPRRAIHERYEEFDDYLSQYRQAAEALAVAGYVLSEDMDLMLDWAKGNREMFRTRAE